MSCYSQLFQLKRILKQEKMFEEGVIVLDEKNIFL